MEKRSKLYSRKFWLGVAAFLGSVAASIAGLMTNNNVVVVTGIVCGVLSVGIYQALEATVDRASAVAVAQSNASIDIKMDDELSDMIKQFESDYSALQELKNIPNIINIEGSGESVIDNLSSTEDEDAIKIDTEEVVAEATEEVKEEPVAEVEDIKEEVVEKSKKKRGRPKKSAS